MSDRSTVMPQAVKTSRPASDHRTLAIMAAILAFVAATLALLAPTVAE